MAEQSNGVPSLPCPQCGVNLLEKGFYNYCSETVSLREDNYAYVRNDRLYVDHNEDNHETQDHECQLDAYCRDCDTLLPWPLFELRDLDGYKLTEAPNAVAELLAKLKNDESQQAGERA